LDAFECSAQISQVSSKTVFCNCNNVQLLLSISLKQQPVFHTESEIRVSVLNTLKESIYI